MGGRQSQEAAASDVLRLTVTRVTLGVDHDDVHRLRVWIKVLTGRHVRRDQVPLPALYADADAAVTLRFVSRRSLALIQSCRQWGILFISCVDYCGRSLLNHKSADRYNRTYCPPLCSLLMYLKYGIWGEGTTKSEYYLTPWKFVWVTYINVYTRWKQPHIGYVFKYIVEWLSYVMLIRMQVGHRKQGHVIKLLRGISFNL